VRNHVRNFAHTSFENSKNFSELKFQSRNRENASKQGGYFLNMCAIFAHIARTSKGTDFFVSTGVGRQS